MTNAKYKLFEDILKEADVRLDGQRPWDINIKDDKFFDRILECGSLGLGESYMDGFWECEAIDEMISRVLKSDIEHKMPTTQKLKLGGHKLKQMMNPQSIARVKKDVPFHYDIGNDLFESMLDKYMTYTCAYFKDTKSLDQAQEQKLDLVCRKMRLKAGMRVLDIGCGWGSFMKYAVEHYGVICDGLTLSKEQKDLGEVKCKDLDINFILQDYREFTPTEKYDRVVSIGMIEHVGALNYKEYFDCANDFLKENGLFLLHTIGGVETSTGGDPWIKKYIFPNGIIPSISQLGQAFEGKLNLEDLHNIGRDYDKTLMAWCKNFEGSWDKLKAKYDEKFHRMWRYYLLSCAGAFRSRDLNTWQLVLSKRGNQNPEFLRSV